MNQRIKKRDRIYARRDTVKQGHSYAKHVDHMTREGLLFKSDIAAELAHRDIRIATLEAELAELRTELNEHGIRDAG